MLKEILEELNFEYSLLLEDSCSCPAQPLLKCLTDHSMSKSYKVLLMELEGCCMDSSLFIGLQSMKITTETTADDLTKQLPNSDCVVILPSLSLLTMFKPIQTIASLIRALKAQQQVVKLIGLVHIDVLPSEDTLNCMEYLFDTIVTSVPFINEPHLQHSYQGHVKSRRLKPSGRVDTSDEYYCLKHDFTIELVHASASSVIKSIMNTSSTSDGLSKLTFNLNLSDQEREAKNKLQLPYIKKQEEKEALLGNTLINRSGEPQVKIEGSASASSGGKIYYHYDEADDFDEEDPDDDLDI